MMPVLFVAVPCSKCFRRSSREQPPLCRSDRNQVSGASFPDTSRPRTDGDYRLPCEGDGPETGGSPIDQLSSWKALVNVAPCFEDRDCAGCESVSLCRIRNCAFQLLETCAMMVADTPLLIGSCCASSTYCNASRQKFVGLVRQS